MNDSPWQTGMTVTPENGTTYRAIIAGKERILSGYSGQSHPGKQVVLLHFKQGAFSREVIGRIRETTTQSRTRR